MHIVENGRACKETYFLCVRAGIGFVKRSVFWSVRRGLYWLIAVIPIILLLIQTIPPNIHLVSSEESARALIQEQYKEEFTIKLKSRGFLPEEGIQNATLSKLDAMITQEGKTPHIMIQLRDIPSRMEEESLKANGIELVSYIGGKAWFASISNKDALLFWDAEVASKNPSLASIRWIGEIYPEDKIAPGIREKGIGDWARTADGKVELVVSHFKDADAEETRRKLEAHGASILGEIDVTNKIVISIDEGKIQALAAENSIRWIEPVPPPSGAESDRIRTHLQVDDVQDWQGSACAGLSGDGVIVGVFEHGHVTTAHQDLSGRVTKTEADPWDVTSYHPTASAGVIAGDGYWSATGGHTPYLKRGMAPEAEIYTYDFYVGVDPTLAEQYINYAGTDTTPGDLQNAIGTDGIDISSNSWGTYGSKPSYEYGVYNGLCPILDAAVRGDYGGQVIVVFSAGNERDGWWDEDAGQEILDCITDTDPPFENYFTMNHPKAAKNTIVVGAIDSTNNRMTKYSSWGPVADGRIKPDIVASGQYGGDFDSGISTLENAEGYLVPWYDPIPYYYASHAMTSCASAAASGCIALMLEGYRETMETDPLPSTVKALLIHTAMDLDDPTSWYNPGPDYASGYGLLQIKDAIDLIGIGSSREGKVQDGGSEQYYIDVPTGVTSLRFTLAWDDYPAVENAASALVNDLDLIVEDPNGVRRYPWTLDPVNPSDPASRDFEDHTNNVEQVLVDTGLIGGPLPDGTWTITVVGTTVPESPQRYSLVADYPLMGQIDIIQVLDRSGSMGGKASLGSMETKIEVLRTAAVQFIDIMKPDIGDGLGLVQFNEDVVTFLAGYMDELAELDSARAAYLTSTTVSSITHGGWTSIGDGLAEARDQLINTPVDPEHDRAILLVTDGKENRDLMIQAVQQDLIDSDIAVYALGLGYGSGINEAKLTDLAGITGGTYRITSDDLIFRKLFIEALAGAVDWSLITDPIGELTRSESITFPFTIAVDEDGATFTAYWEGVDDAISIELITPNGKVITPETTNRWIRYGEHPRYKFYQLDFPLDGDLAGEWAGVWTANLTGTNQIGDTQSVRYSISAFAEGGAQLSITFDKLLHLTGDNVQVMAQVIQSGVPLGDVDINVYGNVPSVSIGNLLHDANVSLKELTTKQGTTNDLVSLVNCKLQILAEMAEKDIFQRKEANFKLSVKSVNGNGNNNTFSNVFDQTEIPGSYTFRIVASNIPAGGGLTTTREWTKSFYTEVNIDPDYSEINIVKLSDTANGSNYDVMIAPMDIFGNYLGPGHEVTAIVMYAGIERQIQLTDNVDGTYSKELSLTSDEVRAGAELGLQIDGKMFTTIDQLPSNGQFPTLILVVIIILVLVVLFSAVILYRKRRRD